MAVTSLDRYQEFGIIMSDYEKTYKPCPFCGFEVYTFKNHGDWFHVVCDDCRASSQCFQEIEDAIEAWNKRV